MHLDQRRNFIYRYVYGWVRVDNWRQTLIKKDLADTRNDKLWSLPSNYPGEVIFIPNPGMAGRIVKLGQKR